jgi:hypothetical protein
MTNHTIQTIFPCKEIIANDDIYAILLIEIGATMGIKVNMH